MGKNEISKYVSEVEVSNLDDSIEQLRYWFDDLPLREQEQIEAFSLYIPLLRYLHQRAANAHSFRATSYEGLRPIKSHKKEI